ncbi:MAG: peptidase T [Tannerella sp.]|jgi:tripeptide aminopeptidase|nr:peptidase T [Tannerella sp.]
MSKYSQMRVTERFLRYVAVDTQSRDHVPATPSTPGQRELAGMLAEELVQIGMQEVGIDSNGYLMATLPANMPRENAPVIGFIAHLDTSPDFSGKNVNPRIVTCTGNDIVLNDSKHIVLSPRIFPELSSYAGQNIIVTDGTTLLGADDKAGIAAIVSAMEYLIDRPDIPHGKVRIAFTPDEEIGRGADFFDVERFGCEWAYTVDGGELGGVEYENFNAANVTLTIQGRNVHPGEAKGKMVNAILVGMELCAGLPSGERPELTGGYEGFYHLAHFSGNVEKATLMYLIRDHDRILFDEKKWVMQWTVRQLNRKYHECITMEMKDLYYNMREIIEQRKEIVTLATDAMQAVGVAPSVKPVRGGTDGARLSFAGLPCPNLFTGGLNGHGPYEFLPVWSLHKSMETVVEIIKTA